MEHPKPDSFSPDIAALSMVEVIAQARRAFAAMNGNSIDAVAQCTPDEGGNWLVVIDTIESPARMGNNDLLCSYQLTITPQGRVAGFQRLGRYHREDGGLG